MDLTFLFDTSQCTNRHTACVLIYIINCHKTMLLQLSIAERKIWRWMLICCCFPQGQFRRLPKHSNAILYICLIINIKIFARHWKPGTYIFPGGSKRSPLSADKLTPPKWKMFEVLDTNNLVKNVIISNRGSPTNLSAHPLPVINELVRWAALMYRIILFITVMFINRRSFV